MPTETATLNPTRLNSADLTDGGTELTARWDYLASIDARESLDWTASALDEPSDLACRPWVEPLPLAEVVLVPVAVVAYVLLATVVAVGLVVWALATWITHRPEQPALFAGLDGEDVR